MSEYIGAAILKAWLSDGEELALLDVREPGQYGLGHPFFAIPLAYSRFELRLRALVPNRSARIALYDDGAGVAEKAAARAEAMGYRNIHVLEGGAPAWDQAGYTLYSGVNVPSKTFGELIEHELGTPRIAAQELKAMQDASEDFVLVDGRPFAEYTRFNIPGGICCPNGELSLRIKQLAPDPKTRIVVNCAGRTRSIIGAQTLIDLGIPNEVVALENGTQGWLIGGLDLEYGASRLYPDLPDDPGTRVSRARVREVAEARGAQYIDAGQLGSWLGEADRTTYVFDVRTEEEFDANGAPGSVHAPGGQLVQATDQWVGVRNARLVVADSDGLRAGMTASWLRQLGHEAYVFGGGVAGLAGMGLPKLASEPEFAALKSISGREAKALADDGSVQLVDIRGSMTYREGHIDGALWSIRPRIATAAQGNVPVLLVADDPGVAALAATELREAGVDVPGYLSGDVTDWKGAGFEIAQTPNVPADAGCIDYLFLTPERNQGNLDDARAYLAWEVGLLDQLDEQERGVFAITPAP